MHPHVHHIPEGTVVRWTEAIKISIRLQHEDEATEISEFLYCFASVNFSTPSVSYNIFYHLSSIQFSSVTQLCLMLCDSMNCSMPSLSAPHQLPEFTQTHVHRVRDTIQPSHPLASPSPPAPNPSEHQSFPKSQLYA